MCHYTHFTTEERELSRVLKAQGLSIPAIARMLNRSPSSVSREFRRNSYSNGTYAAHHADKLYRKRRKNCGRKPKLKASAVRDYVLEKMALRWSPEQIAGRAKRDNEPFSISFPTIYRAIDTGILPPQLKKIMRFKCKHKKCKTEDKRGKIPSWMRFESVQLPFSTLLILLCDKYIFSTRSFCVQPLSVRSCTNLLLRASFVELSIGQSPPYIILTTIS